jgi:uncharacterized protein (TIGR03067 family)
MRTLLATSFCFGLATLAVDGGGKDRTVPLIDGAWAVSSICFPDGKSVSADDLARVRSTFVFKDGQYKAVLGDTVVDAGTYRIDTTRKPVTIDQTRDQASDKGKTYLGILLLDGDTLTLVSGPASKHRPRSFSCPDACIWVMKRTSR